MRCQMMSLHRGLHMAMATSFLLKNIAFLVWALLQAQIQEQQVYLRVINFIFEENCDIYHQVGYIR